MTPALHEYPDGNPDPEVSRGVVAGAESFRFSCTLCGDCCTGSQVIRLTGTDLGQLLVRLGLNSVRELGTQGLVSLIREPLGDGRFLWRPRIRFRSRPLRQCPFLINDVGEDGVYRGLCSLHPDFKPLVCRLSPLTREVVDPGEGPVSETWSVVAPVEGCLGTGRGALSVLGPPADLHLQLDHEVGWIRALISGSGGCPDEESAWGLIVSLVPNR